MKVIIGACTNSTLIRRPRKNCAPSKNERFCAFIQPSGASQSAVRRTRSPPSPRQTPRRTPSRIRGQMPSHRAAQTPSLDSSSAPHPRQNVVTRRRLQISRGGIRAQVLHTSLGHCGTKDYNKLCPVQTNFRAPRPPKDGAAGSAPPGR